VPPGKALDHRPSDTSDFRGEQLAVSREPFPDERFESIAVPEALSRLVLCAEIAQLHVNGIRVPVPDSIGYRAVAVESVQELAQFD